MVDVKTVVVSVVAVLSVFLQPGIRPQPTIGSSSEDDLCSQLKEECEFQAVENGRLQSLQDNERQTMKILENVSYSQAEEIQRLKRELGINQQKIDTLENESNSTAAEICRLNLELVERRRLRRRELQSVTATFISSFDHSQCHRGITKVDNKIYVLNGDPNRIRVYEDAIGFRFMTDIALNGTNSPTSIVYSHESKCVYISDYYGTCIWEMTTTGEHRLTKWLTGITWPNKVWLSNEGNLLVLRQSQSFKQLEIYSLNATLIRRLHLPQDFISTDFVVQTSAGNFIISHLNESMGHIRVISQLTNDGQLINRFIPRNQSQKLFYPHLSLNSDSNQLFATDSSNHRVILFDSCDLTWIRVLVSQQTNGIRNPVTLFYDASKRHLFVAGVNANVTVFEIN